MDNVSLSELISYKTSGQLYPDGLVFKTMWGFFYILIGCVATCLSSLLIKILLIHITLQVIVEIYFSSFFRLVSWESLDQILRQLVKFIYLTNLFKEDTFA